MDFPILDLVDDDLATRWLLNHFHPEGLKCPHCGAGVMEARPFRQTTQSQLTVHRCLQCQGIYNLYSGTVFQQKQLRPAQAVLLLRGVCKGESSAQIAREIGLTRQTVLSLYFDGAEVGTEELKTAPDVKIDFDAFSAIIGGNGWRPPGEFWDAIVDEVGFYNRALTAAEVSRNFTAPQFFAVEPLGKLSLTWAKIKASQ